MFLKTGIYQFKTLSYHWHNVVWPKFVIITWTPFLNGLQYLARWRVTLPGGQRVTHHSRTNKRVNHLVTGDLSLSRQPVRISIQMDAKELRSPNLYVLYFLFTHVITVIFITVFTPIDPFPSGKYYNSCFGLFYVSVCKIYDTAD